MAAIVLKYNIVKVSSEEEDYPASELLSPGPDCKGWVTEKYCVYPQVNRLPSFERFKLYITINLR